jgi:hypothetical protein
MFPQRPVEKGENESLDCLGNRINFCYQGGQLVGMSFGITSPRGDLVVAAAAGGAVGIGVKTVYDRIDEWLNPPEGKLQDGDVEILTQIQNRYPKFGEHRNQPPPFWELVDAHGNPKFHFSKNEAEDLYCKGKLNYDCETKKTALKIIQCLERYISNRDSDSIDAKTVFAGALKVWISLTLSQGDNLNISYLHWMVEFLLEVQKLKCFDQGFLSSIFWRDDFGSVIAECKLTLNSLINKLNKIQTANKEFLNTREQFIAIGSAVVHLQWCCVQELWHMFSNESKRTYVADIEDQKMSSVAGHQQIILEVLKQQDIVETVSYVHHLLQNEMKAPDNARDSIAKIFEKSRMESMKSTFEEFLKTANGCTFSVNSLTNAWLQLLCDHILLRGILSRMQKCLVLVDMYGQSAGLGKRKQIALFDIQHVLPVLGDRISGVKSIHEEVLRSSDGHSKQDLATKILQELRTALANETLGAEKLRSFADKLKMTQSMVPKDRDIIEVTELNELRSVAHMLGLEKEIRTMEQLIEVSDSKLNEDLRNYADPRTVLLNTLFGDCAVDSIPSLLGDRRRYKKVLEDLAKQHLNDERLSADHIEELKFAIDQSNITKNCRDRLTKKLQSSCENKGFNYSDFKLRELIDFLLNFTPQRVDQQTHILDQFERYKNLSVMGSSVAITESAIFAKLEQRMKSVKDAAQYCLSNMEENSGNENSCFDALNSLQCLVVALLPEELSVVLQSKKLPHWIREDTALVFHDELRDYMWSRVRGHSSLDNPLQFVILKEDGEESVLHFVQCVFLLVWYCMVYNDVVELMRPETVKQVLWFRSRADIHRQAAKMLFD